MLTSIHYAPNGDQINEMEPHVVVILSRLMTVFIVTLMSGKAFFNHLTRCGFAGTVHWSILA